MSNGEGVVGYKSEIFLSSASSTVSGVSRSERNCAELKKGRNESLCLQESQRGVWKRSGRQDARVDNGAAGIKASQAREPPGSENLLEAKSRRFIKLDRNRYALVTVLATVSLGFDPRSLVSHVLRSSNAFFSVPAQWWQITDVRTTHCISANSSAKDSATCCGSETPAANASIRNWDRESAARMSALLSMMR